MKALVIILIFISVANSEVDDTHYAKAEIQSCRGCQLKYQPEVKSFIFDDVPKYENVEFKPIQGAPPELVLYNESYEELKRVPLRDRTRKECNELLAKYGFNVKSENKFEL